VTGQNSGLERQHDDAGEEGKAREDSQPNLVLKLMEVQVRASGNQQTITGSCWKSKMAGD
jgi:hypothetical protein